MNYRPIQKAKPRQRVIPYGLPIYSTDRESSPDSLRHSLIGAWGLDSRPFLNKQGYGLTFSEINGPLNIVAGKVGNCVQFDGVTAQYLQYTLSPAPPASSPLNIQHPVNIPFTISAWVTLTDKTAARSAVAVVSGFRLGYINTSDKFRISSGVVSADVVTPVLGDWYHLLLTFNGNSTELLCNSVYINGEFQAGFQSLSVANTDVQIGARNGAQLWAGKIDEVYFWRRYFNSDEVRSVYKLGLQGKSILP